MDFTLIKSALSKLSNVHKETLSAYSISRWNLSMQDDEKETAHEMAATISGYLAALVNSDVITNDEMRSLSAWLFSGTRGLQDMEFVLQTM